MLFRYMNYIVYVFMVVRINPYIEVLEDLSRHVETIWTAQIINTNRCYVNNDHNLLFTLF